MFRFLTPATSKTAALGMAVLAGILATQLLPTSAQRVQTWSDPLVETPTVREETEPVDGTTVLLTTGAIVSAVGIGLKLSSDRNARRLGPLQNQTVMLSQASRKLQKKLLLLLHEDHQAATRLLTQAKFNHPHKSINWYVEKVIYDLERDRGRY